MSFLCWVRYLLCELGLSTQAWVTCWRCRDCGCCQYHSKPCVKSKFDFNALAQRLSESGAYDDENPVGDESV